MKKLLFVLAMGQALMAAAQENNQVSDRRLTGLDTAFARVLSLWKGAGFAVAVVEKNKIVYARGFGFRNT